MFKAKDYGATTFVTGMRAWAVLGVLLVHAGGAGLRSLGPLGQALVGLGTGGVVAFFVISGFSVAASYDASGGFGRYLFLRFLRLAPLYYFWILLYALFLRRGGYWAQNLGVQPWAWDLGLHALFLHGFFLQTANSILGVEWSLTVEMAWYLFLPALLWLARKSRVPWMPLLGLLLFFALRAFYARRLETDPLFAFQIGWHPLSYLFSFALGVFSFLQRSKVAAQERALGVRLALLLFVALVFCAAYTPRWAVAPPISIAIISALFLLYADAKDLLVRTLFTSQAALLLGTLSYGLYLSHLFVLNFLQRFFGEGAWSAAVLFVAVLVLSGALSWATWMGLEMPAQAWAKSFWPAVNKSA